MYDRDVELLEAIRRDDLAYVLTTRYEKPFSHLFVDDTPSILMDLPSPLMVAAYFGALKCFNFFNSKKKNSDYTDTVCFCTYFGVCFYFLIDMLFIWLQRVETF